MTELPTAFGKYFLTEKLATGGMAEIYLAKLVGPGGFEKQLVIKQIHPKLSGNRHFIDLFVAEAKTLVTLAHGNIVPVYELGVLDDTYFIAMEYIDGPTLYRLTETLARREVRMAPAIAAWITARIVEGLDYAHRKGEGVIHRDLSPRNVMLSRDGEVKLVDFGIAVTLGAADGTTDVQSAPTGSFPYMSPEQVRREPLNGQTDLFSVGVLFWEMLVGQRLFARPDPDATLAAVTDSEIARPSTLRPEIPPQLDDVVMRALERDRSERYASAGEMLTALQKYLYGLDEMPGPRDIGALVAKYCPPETRRLPTHADPPSSTNADADAQPAPAGPRTAVIPRASTPRGPAGQKKTRARTETFATHVELKNMLERATPLFPIDAITDEPPPPETPAKVRAASNGESLHDSDGGSDIDAIRASTRLRAVRTDDISDPDAEIPRPPPPRLLPGREPPSRTMLVTAAIGTLAIGAAALYVFSRGRASVERPDAAPKLDAAWYAIDHDLPDAPPPPDAAEPIDAEPAAVLDTARAAIVDAAPATVHDARRGELPDAGTRTRPDAGAPPDAPRATGSATLVIGAEPWGEIYVDGRRVGQAPPVQTVTVTAGHHVVEIHGGDDPPKHFRRELDVSAGANVPLQIDMSKQ